MYRLIGPYRQFLNLVVRDMDYSIYSHSLRRMNISKNLFYPSPEDAQAAITKKKTGKKIGRWNSLPRAEIHFENPPCFSTLLTDSCILFGNSAGHTATYDTNLNCLGTIPSFNLSKGLNSICFYSRQHNAHIEDSRCLYVMDLFPGTGKNSSFEVLDYFEDNVTSLPPVISNFAMASYWRELPPPPFLGNPANQSPTNMFSSAAVDTRTICVSSMEDGIGTYNFDTESRVWSQAGEWVLPFYGKAEYVPELNLWFGRSRCSPHCLCSFDLSTMDHDRPPVLKNAWNYLDLQVGLPEPYQRHLVNLGICRFCVVSFYKTTTDEGFAVFTGLEVVPCNNGEAPLHMIEHMSKRYNFGSHRIKSVL